MARTIETSSGLERVYAIIMSKSANIPQCTKYPQCHTDVCLDWGFMCTIFCL